MLVLHAQLGFDVFELLLYLDRKRKRAKVGARCLASNLDFILRFTQIYQAYFVALAQHAVMLRITLGSRQVVVSGVRMSRRHVCEPGYQRPAQFIWTHLNMRRHAPIRLEHVSNFHMRIDFPIFEYLQDRLIKLHPLQILRLLLICDWGAYLFCWFEKFPLHYLFFMLVVGRHVLLLILELDHGWNLERLELLLVVE